MAAEGLRGEPAGTHTEEAEQPADDVEYHCTYGNAPDIGSIAHVAHNGKVHQAQQWHSDIGDNGRNGNVEDFLVEGCESSHDFFSLSSLRERPR